MQHARVAIVTGSSRGIGRGIALRLARDGFFVVVNYVSRKEAADQVVDQIRSEGGRSLAVRADVTRAGDREELVERALGEAGGLDLLVNNAGITSPGRVDLLEASEQSWNRVFDTNLKGPFFLAQRCARKMIELIAEGRISAAKIVNISSISAFAVSTNRADYCMAKAAMTMMTHLLADRLAEHNILVYEVCPGVIASDMTAPVKEKYDRLIAEGLTPLRRWGQPEDVARAVSALAADAFPFSTGQCIYVDGGFHIRRL